VALWTWAVGLKDPAFWVCDMALVVRAIEIDPVPAGWKEIVHSDASRARVERERACIIPAAGVGVYLPPVLLEAAVGHGVAFAAVALVAGCRVTDDHAEAGSECGDIGVTVIGRNVARLKQPIRSYCKVVYSKLGYGVLGIRRGILDCQSPCGTLKHLVCYIWHTV
jgi:hypothetical protein